MGEYAAGQGMGFDQGGVQVGRIEIGRQLDAYVQPAQAEAQFQRLGGACAQVLHFVAEPPAAGRLAAQVQGATQGGAGLVIAPFAQPDRGQFLQGGRLVGSALQRGQPAGALEPATFHRVQQVLDAGLHLRRGVGRPPHAGRGLLEVGVVEGGQAAMDVAAGDAPAAGPHGRGGLAGEIGPALRSPGQAPVAPQGALADRRRPGPVAGVPQQLGQIVQRLGIGRIEHGGALVCGLGLLQQSRRGPGLSSGAVVDPQRAADAADGPVQARGRLLGADGLLQVAGSVPQHVFSSPVAGLDHSAFAECSGQGGADEQEFGGGRVALQAEPQRLGGLVELALRELGAGQQGPAHGGAGVLGHAGFEGADGQRAFAGHDQLEGQPIQGIANGHGQSRQPGRAAGAVPGGRQQAQQPGYGRSEPFAVDQGAAAVEQADQDLGMDGVGVGAIDRGPVKLHGLGVLAAFGGPAGGLVERRGRRGAPDRHRDGAQPAGDQDRQTVQGQCPL